MQIITNNTQSTRGRKKGSNNVQLKPQSEWAFLPSCKNFLNFLINEGRHIKLHISGRKSQNRGKIYEKEKENKDTYNKVEQVAQKYLNYKISDRNQVIYFFRPPNSPNKRIDEIIVFLKKRWGQYQNYTQKKLLENQQQQFQQTKIVFPLIEDKIELPSPSSSPKYNQYWSFNVFQEEQNFNQFNSDESAQLQQQNIQQPKYEFQQYLEISDQLQQQNTQKYYNDGQWLFEESVYDRQFINKKYHQQCDYCNTQKPQLLKKDSYFQEINDDWLIFPNQSFDENIQEIADYQNNNEQIEQENTICNPFLLDFIDPDLAKTLEKIWYLLDEEFIFELVLIFYANQNKIDITNILFNRAAENNNFSLILQNIFIKKIINKEPCINGIINEKLESFREKFQKLFESEEAKIDVENFFQSIYSIVKHDENTGYQQEYKGTPQVQSVPQEQRQKQDLYYQPEKKLKFE